MIIGIGHKARQGKDTAAEFLHNKYGFTIIHFADALYDECRNCTVLYNELENVFYLKCYNEEYSVFKNPPEYMIKWMHATGEQKSGIPFNSQWIYNGMKEKDGTILQFWGTEFRRRKFNWDYWVDKVRQVIEKNPNMDYVIPDTRFINEAQFIKSVGGDVWKIIRPNYNQIDRDPSHKSEVDLDDWEFDEVIFNDGTIDDLFNKINEVYQKRKKLYESKENR